MGCCVSKVPAEPSENTKIERSPATYSTSDHVSASIPSPSDSSRYTASPKSEAYQPVVPVAETIPNTDNKMFEAKRESPKSESSSPPLVTRSAVSTQPQLPSIPTSISAPVTPVDPASTASNTSGKKKTVRQLAIEKREREKAEEEQAKSRRAQGASSPRHMHLMSELDTLTENRLERLHATLSFPRGTEYEHLTHLKFTIRPTEGIYRGGTFEFLCDVPSGYKHEAPKVRCTTPLYHPNITNDGAICLNILREDWLPTLSLEDILVGLLHLFVAPNPSDPLNIEAGQLMRKDPVEFEKKARKSCGLR